MKTFSLISISLIAGCARDARAPSTPPPPPPSPPAANVEIPDLELGMKQVDDLPITELVDPGAREKQPVKEAIAVLHSTRGNEVTGVVRFVEVEGRRGVDVFAVAHGLDAGPHAYHVHAYGDCSAEDATSAGPHFHFFGSSFDKEVGIVTGNLGELRKHEQGPTSTHRARIENASLQGEFSIIGRAVVVHEHGNNPDVTPDGGAGARLACGVIGVANPSAPKAAQR